MKLCPRCNLNFPDSLTFCESCGGGLGEAVSLRCPACGETAQPGWKFCVKCQTQLPSSGIGDSYNPIERSEPSPTLPLVPPETSTTAPLREEVTARSSQETISNIQIRVRCRSCKSLVDEDSVFCEFCGTNMFEDTAPLIVSPPPASPTQTLTSQQTHGHDTVYEAASADETTAVRPKPYANTRAPVPREITSEKTAPSLSILQGYGQTESTAQFKWWHGLLVAIFVLVVFAALGAGGWYWWSHRGSEAQSSPQPLASPTPATATTSSPSSLSSNQGATNQAQPADTELKQLRVWRVSAPPSDANKIVAAIEDAEKKYPTDYRFPYERAKLSIKGMISHHEAFEAIFLAAQKAIDNGKAQEMLSDLMSDKDGDFYKMSRGHHEWATLEAALRNKDKSSLAIHHE